MVSVLHSFLSFQVLGDKLWMFGKVEALVEKYPVFFYSRVVNKFYSQRQNIRCTQWGGSAKLKKKFGFSMYYLYSFACSWLKKVLLVLISSST